MTEDFDIGQETEAQELPLPSEEEAYEAPQKPGLSNRQKIIFVSIGAAVLITLLGLIIGLLLFSGRNDDDDRILENVFAAGIDLSGMTVEEAVNALHVATDRSFADEPLVIRIYDDTLLLPPEDTNASVDVDGIAQAAYNYGRSGNHAENQQIRRNAHKRSFTIPLLPYLNLDLTAIRNTVDSYCAALDSDYAEPVVTLEGERPTYGASQSPNHQALRITLGTPLRQLDADDLYDQILDAYSMNESQLDYEAPEILWPSEVNAQDLYNEYCTPAQDARLDTSTYNVIAESYGYGFDVNLLEQLLNDAEPGEEVEIAFSFLEPKVLAQDITDSLYTLTLSEAQTTSKAQNSERSKNLQLSCNAINGHIIKPGETFSFLQVLGQISPQAGYSDAPICNINGDAMGGGISQTASTLYYCALHADLEVVERHNHPYTTDFIELGMDAYVDGSALDLRFRNNTDAPIRINASVSGQTVSISLEGSKALSYAISVRSEITGKSLPTTTYQMVMPDNRQGYKDGDVMVSAVEGYQVSVYKDKLSLEGGSLLSTEPVSTNEYKKRDEVIARIGTLSDTQTPPEPTEPLTDPMP